MGIKTFIWGGGTIGGVGGGLVGALLDGTGIGAWSIVFSTIGGLIGIWAGYKLHRRVND